MEKFTGRYSGPRAVVFCAVVLVACAVGFTADSDEAEPQDQEVLTPLEQRLQKKISVDFRDTPIDDVIRIMAEQVNVDIVKSPAVTGNVTATLTNVPLEEALGNILAAHGYGYVPSKNMIRVAPLAEISQEAEQLVHRIYRITYADVLQVERALQKFISSRGSISSNPGTSNIIVTDAESKIKAIDTFVAEIDRMTAQVLVEARIYDISSTDQLDLGFEWFLGSRTDFTDGGGASGAQLEPFVAAQLDSAITQTPRTDGLIRFGVLNENVNIDVMFTANQEIIDAKLLASPRVLVLDNEEADFKIIEERPFQELTQTQGGGNIGTTQFKEVGVELRVTPHIAREGMIRLHLMAKFSTQTDTVSIVIPVPGATPITSPQPVIATREADTKVLIQDGQTVVLGGLRKKTVLQEISKIPVLSDMPVFGGLFKFEGEEIINSELVVFITPKIVLEPVMTENERRQFEETEAQTCTPEFNPPKVDRCAD